MATAEDTVLAYWAACEARDWVRFGALLAEDVVYDLPQTRERIHGRRDYLRFNQEYPGDWHLTVVRVVGSGRHAASWTSFTVDGGAQPATTFFELDNAGAISRVTEFWPEPYDPPAGREHLVERY
ncbi:nuclear transport factor 2 family protein [Micromonospora mirobrigensis]|uniref:SnoaL-like domain-containing protein n=1 Tax=Micromonospora mirobrigensis TaxID=262898 RepID=A0A1C4X697_9ACTN|nr:nuclear transport factor 2 family protein [Micromonospora mirobrigensis]SCF03978.1 SnoaL-like domain-containing protein [Micromonospora mirobrigensis]